MAGDQGTIGGYSWGNQRCVAKPLGQMLDAIRTSTDRKSVDVLIV